jgi:hypothetical protein
MSGTGHMGRRIFFHTAGDYATFERMLIAAQGRGEGDADLLRDVYSLAPGLMGGLPLTHTQRRQSHIHSL